MSNQLKMTDKFQMATHLKENWDTYKTKTQNELAGLLAHKFNRKVTRLNVSSILKMAGLRQEGRAGTGPRRSGPSARTITALTRTMIIVTEALRALEPKLNEAYDSIAQWPAEERPIIFSEGADDELDTHLLILREHLSKTDSDTIKFGGAANTAPLNDDELSKPVTTVDEEIDNILDDSDEDDSEEDEEDTYEDEDSPDLDQIPVSCPHPYTKDADAPNYEGDLNKEIEDLKIDLNSNDMDNETLSELQERIRKVQAKMEAAKANSNGMHDACD